LAIVELLDLPFMELFLLLQLRDERTTQ
jgi:hypothetical protein